LKRLAFPLTYFCQCFLKRHTNSLLDLLHVHSSYYDTVTELGDCDIVARGGGGGVPVTMVCRLPHCQMAKRCHHTDTLYSVLVNHRASFGFFLRQGSQLFFSKIFLPSLPKILPLKKQIRPLRKPTVFSAAIDQKKTFFLQLLLVSKCNIFTVFQRRLR
jgi:hypothetical protein